MLKTTKIELELLTDIDMYNFIMKGIRGGLVQCRKRHSIANNKYLTNDYDCEKESNYAMSQAIPYKNVKWLEKTEEGNFENFDLNTCVDDQSIGYILEVDFEYTENLHSQHNDLPFCSQNKKTENMQQSKLIADLSNKYNYIIHYRNLQQCLRHGLILKKIHRILQFIYLFKMIVKFTKLILT